MNWLSEVDVDKLITKSRCFVDQYAKQVINPFYKRRNTLQTLKEDLCDNGNSFFCLFKTHMYKVEILLLN
jgi:hypothetical protein